MKIIWQSAITQEKGAPYMTRWGIMSRWLTIYIHRYADGDGTRDLHDHPWSVWFSLVLRGWLNECRQHPHYSTNTETVHRGAGSLCRCSGDIKHRIISVLPGGTWTLFVGWRRVRQWGFIDNKGVKHFVKKK